jgi:hypothetical protein
MPTAKSEKSARFTEKTTFGALVDLHIEDMREVGKSPRRSKQKCLEQFKRDLGRFSYAISRASGLRLRQVLIKRAGGTGHAAGLLLPLVATGHPLRREDDRLFPRREVQDVDLQLLKRVRLAEAFEHERDYRKLKQEVGLGHFEGRGWRGFHHHATLSIAAYGFLICERGAFPPCGVPAVLVIEAPRLPEGRRPRGAPTCGNRRRCDVTCYVSF